MNEVEAAFYSSVYNWPSLYYSQNIEDSRRRWLNHMFLVIGNGIEYYNPKNEDGKGSFLHGFERIKHTLALKKIKDGIDKGQKIAQVGNLDMKIVKIMKHHASAWNDTDKKYRRLFFKDFLKEKVRFIKRGSKIRGKVSENTLVVTIYPQKSEEYKWRPYPYSIEHMPFWNRVGKCLIPKSKIAPEWVEAILWIVGEAKKWMENDELFYGDSYFNWAGANWKESSNALVGHWKKCNNDLIQICKDYGLPYKEYSTPQEMAKDCVEKSRKQYLDMANRIIQHYS